MDETYVPDVRRGEKRPFYSTNWVSETKKKICILCRKLFTQLPLRQAGGREDTRQAIGVLP